VLGGGLAGGGGGAVWVEPTLIGRADVGDDAAEVAEVAEAVALVMWDREADAVDRLDGAGRAGAACRRVRRLALTERRMACTADGAAIAPARSTVATRGPGAPPWCSTTRAFVCFGRVIR
jgi:hypothetical protein